LGLKIHVDLLRELEEGRTVFLSDRSVLGEQPVSNGITRSDTFATRRAGPGALLSVGLIGE
jgi:hypothetical protein